jgi:hypothetical protein
VLRALFLVLISLVATISTSGQARAAVTIALEGDSTLTVAAVAWSSPGFVAFVRPDGTEGYLGVQKIKGVADEAGKDRTRDVLESRRTVRTPPPGYKGHLGRGSFTIARAFVATLMVGVIALGFAIHLVD